MSQSDESLKGETVTRINALILNSGRVVEAGLSLADEAIAGREHPFETTQSCLMKAHSWRLM